MITYQNNRSTIIIQYLLVNKYERLKLFKQLAFVYLHLTVTEHKRGELIKKGKKIISLHIFFLLQLAES